ncbi:GAF and ANTAR domain-containing protein [Kineococcus sp. SYSU DK001]|uniref:GAF and ANTAR domain-containing protein n=1 Tax=Kineococcus sp. SYSU DK001 TaxID=3383122 RepID=UPI003D7EE153
MPLPLEAALLELGRLLADQPLTGLLRRVADLAVECVPGADDVSITLLRNGKPFTAAFHGDLAVELDERQYSLGFGPCVAAAQSGGTVRIDDTAHDPDFTDFSVLAHRRGVRSVVAVGLPDPDRCQGAVNVYCFGNPPHPVVTERAQRDLGLFARYAAVALGNAAALAAAGEKAEHLQIAMRSRAVIEQAKGVLVAEHGIGPDEAFELLSRRSQDENRKLRIVADEIVREAAAGRSRVTR